MSLMRRREMIKGQELGENVIYIYNGYANMAGRYDDMPYYNSQYPNSIATSSIPVDAGDKSVVTYTSCAQFRSRLYNSNGDYYNNQNSFNVTVLQDGYIRFVAHMGIGSFDSIKIVKLDGMEIDYKIVDMR